MTPPAFTVESLRVTDIHRPPYDRRRQLATFTVVLTDSGIKLRHMRLVSDPARGFRAHPPNTAEAGTAFNLPSHLTSAVKNAALRTYRKRTGIEGNGHE